MTEPWGNQNQGESLPPLNSDGQQAPLPATQPQYQQQPPGGYSTPQGPQQYQQVPPQPTHLPQFPTALRGNSAVSLKKDRSWYQKKRFVLPAAALGLFIFMGSVASANTPTTALTDKASATGGIPASPTPSDSVTPTTTVTPAAPSSPAPVTPSATLVPAAPVKVGPTRAPVVPVVPAPPVPAKAAPAAPVPAPVVPAPAPPVVAAPVAPAPPPVSSTTVSQENAVGKAASYLQFMAFSRGGLIDQLMFDKFSAGDATWAVDHVQVDWNAQAAKKAASYLKYMSFSHSGLIDQLVFDKFTPAQAAYGVSKVGL